MDNLQSIFKEVKNINWNEAIVSFYIVKRSLSKRKATYKILNVNTDESLRKKLRKVAANKVAKSNQALEYDYNTTDLDDNVLGILSNETDLELLIETINYDDDIETATSFETLIDSWMYIARLQTKDSILHSVRRVSEGWTTKKIKQYSINVIFKNNMLIDIEQKDIFKIDDKVDFFSYKGVIFIADKKNFETALNFREGMERNRDIIVAEFKELKLFVDAEEISKLVGDNIKRLRKLSQVKKAEYYKDQNFLKCLKQVNEEEKWGIMYSKEGKLLVTEDDIETVLRLLNNDRLTSKINQETFDVDAKDKFEKN